MRASVRGDLLHALVEAAVTHAVSKDGGQLDRGIADAGAELFLGAGPLDLGSERRVGDLRSEGDGVGHCMQSSTQ